ncbi:hypothetical protein BH24ACI3_BH24ACI3_08600 [soil metagenome]
MSNRKLLLADDSITIQKVVNLTFAEEGIDVITVGDGDSALARISEELPDLVLADVNMPGANGYQVCESIRSNKATEDIPVVLLVGSFEPFDEAEATRVGANAYLTKPFHSIRQLVAQVTELIDSRRQTVDEPAPDPIEDLENVPVEQVSPDDIDTLYDQSFTPQAEVSGEIGSFDISDQGLDDEMIETSYSKDSDTLEFSVVEPTVRSSTSDIPTEEFSTFEVETPYSHPEPHMVDGENFTSVGSPVTETGSDRSVDPSDEAQGQGQHPESFLDNDPESSWSSESAPEPEPVQEMHTVPIPLGPGTGPDEPDEDGASQDSAPELQEPDEQPEVTWQHQPQTGHDPDEQTIAASISTRVLEEIDLLELPPVGEETELEITTPDLAFEHGSRKQLVSLSPELIDIIVQKVIDRMSERS